MYTTEGSKALARFSPDQIWSTFVQQKLSF